MGSRWREVWLGRNSLEPPSAKLCNGTGRVGWIRRRPLGRVSVMHLNAFFHSPADLFTDSYQEKASPGDGPTPSAFRPYMASLHRLLVV